MTYYAILDGSNTVKKVMLVEQTLANPPTNWIELPNAEVAENALGKQYTVSETATTSVSSEVQPLSDFTLWVSTEEIYRGENMNHAFSTDFSAVETDVATLKTGKADTNHTHTGYATADHTHTGYATTEHTHSGYASASHSHSYNELTDKPTIPEAYTHPATHPASMITGLPTTLPANGGNADTVDGKHSTDFATAEHTHSGYATAEELEAVETAVSGKADSSHTHIPNQITGLTAALANKASVSHTHTEYATAEHNHDTTYAGINHNHDTEYADISHVHTAAEITETTDKKIMTATERAKLSGIAEGANAYTHPTYTAKSAGLYKVAVDGSGHVSGATAVTKADITALGVPSTNTTYGNASTSTAGLMSTSDKSKLDGIATGANKTTVDSALSSTSTNPVQNKVINTALAGKSNTSHTHTAAQIGAALESHNHDSDYIAKALQMTTDNGSVEYEMAEQDVLAVFEAMPMGLHTGYCPVDSTNAPLSNESWRFLMHKTGTNNYGWIVAFGSYGSVYTNYVNGGTWRGWKNLVDGTSAPLWKHESNGGYYMTASQTVTPSKPLDKCRNGWLLLWSDYDPGTGTTNNADFCTTQIPKRNGVGSLWSGQGFLCTVPTYMTETTDVDNFHIKKVYVHNDKLVGYVGNNVSDRRDAVLRAVYEF